MDFNSSLGVDKPVLFIAEIGQNHQGNLDTAKRLIEKAKQCGADCVKFQKTNLEAKFTKSALDQPYDSPHSWGKTYGEHKAYLEFSNDEFKKLQQHASKLGILFTASAMDPISLDFLVSINVPFIKIGSGDANNFPMIKQAASKHIPLVISTGMQTFETVKQVYNIVSQYHKNFALLHCVSAYPMPPEDANLRVIELYKKEFPDITIGYSGHELGWIISAGAVALGATIIERHITLDNSWKGSDHKCSLLPEEFETMVDNINTLVEALGEPHKEIRLSEIPCHNKLRKTIVASKFIPKGAVLSQEDLNIKVAEPHGIDGSLISEVIGKQTSRELDTDQPLMENDIA